MKDDFTVTFMVMLCVAVHCHTTMVYWDTSTDMVTLRVMSSTCVLRQYNFFYQYKVFYQTNITFYILHFSSWDKIELFYSHLLQLSQLYTFNSFLMYFSNQFCMLFEKNRKTQLHFGLDHAIKLNN